ncbi:MAG TPA: glycosyltransferase family 39 protein [Polyangia bacterium]
MSIARIAWDPRVRRRLAAACAAALIVGAAPTFLRPFVNDDATYVLIAQKLNAGGLLYRDAVDNKPPLIYATFAAVLRLCGPSSVAAIKVLTIAVELGCATLLFLIGARLFGRRVGAWAALFFSLATVTGVAEDFAAPNTETYMNLFVLGALWFLAREPERPTRRSLVAAGLLLGVAALYRPQGAAPLLGALLYFLRQRRDRPTLPAAALWMAAGLALPLLGALGYLAARGTLGELWLWAVRSNWSYVRVGAEGVGWRALRRIGLVILSQAPLLAAGIPAAAAWPRTPEPERTRCELVWTQLIAALVAYQLGSRFYGHYFLQLLPFLSLLAAWAYATLPHRRWPALRLLPGLLVLWMIGFAVANTVRLSTSGEADGFPETVAFARAHTVPGDELFLWSASARIAYDRDRRFATRFPFNASLTGSMFGTDHVLPGATRETNRALESPEAWRRLREDLGALPPALIVDGRRPGFELRRYPLLDDYVGRLYEPPVRLGTFDVYRRRERPPQVDRPHQRSADARAPSAPARALTSLWKAPPQRTPFRRLSSDRSPAGSVSSRQLSGAREAPRTGAEREATAPRAAGGRREPAAQVAVASRAVAAATSAAVATSDRAAAAAATSDPAAAPRAPAGVRARPAAAGE